MSKTPITPSVLKDHGFLEMTSDGNVFYVKGNVALAHSIAWEPCNLYTGVPLNTNVQISTLEELERLMIEGDVVKEMK